MTPSLTDRTDIIERILEAAQGGAGLTERKIMYAFSLQSIEVDQYLSSMIRNELLRYDRESSSYRTTEKGHEFLENIRQMSELDEQTD